MKRITKIEINNFKAYYGKYAPLDLPEGQNVLIYGENGSGKSSLYKALNSYFGSSVDPTVNFTNNHYNAMQDGDVTIEFSDFDANTATIIAGTNTSYFFGTKGSNHAVQFIQTAALVKGFLDYTDLLKVYLHDDPEPNLFKLIVLSLLSTYIPVSAGGTKPLGAHWQELQEDLIQNSYTRQDRLHKRALRELPLYEARLRTTLNDIFVELNRLLQDYFPDLAISIGYLLQPLDFNYHKHKGEWYITADLRLTVSKNGVLIVGGYSEYLNEARLSAMAICLYLSSLLRTPAGVDLKILYLDDVFIGLDAGNRLPILNILRAEFSGFQKFISTYDRHWFELAKRHFLIQQDTSWSNIEIYVGTKELPNHQISIPIFTKGLSNYDRALQYLHSRTNPDYPAASNYFRKAIEQLIKEYVPQYETEDINIVQLPEYKLTQLLTRTSSFLNRAGVSIVEVQRIQSMLGQLLHPLSHHEITTPIYRNELILIEMIYSNLKRQLIDLQISVAYKCVLGRNSRIKIRFSSSATHYCDYELQLVEPLVLYNNPAGPEFLASKCYVTKIQTMDGGTPFDLSPKKLVNKYTYTSLIEAVNSILTFVNVNVKNGTFPIPLNYLSVIDYTDGHSWQALAPKAIW